MNQQAVNRAHTLKNFYDCPSSEAYSSLTLVRSALARVFIAPYGRGRCFKL